MILFQWKERKQGKQKKFTGMTEYSKGDAEKGLGDENAQQKEVEEKGNIYL